MEKGSPCKQNEGDKNHSDSQQQTVQLFPDKLDSPLPQWIKLLEEYYEPHLHERILANYCFKCHDIDVATTYQKFLAQKGHLLKEEKISEFFSNESFVQLQKIGSFFKQQNQEYPKPMIGPIPKNMKNLLDNLFQVYGYIPNFERLLLFYPSYLEKQLLLEQSLFNGEKIDVNCALYLAFISSAEMGCVYTMTRFYKRYKRVGGDLKWLTTGQAPSKYLLLNEVNRLMTKAVWEISENMLDNIINESGVHWNKTELYMCIIILAYSHQMSTISLALGLLPEEKIECCSLQYIKQVEKVVKQYHEYYDQPHQIKEEDELKPARVGRRNEEEESEKYMKEIGVELVKQELNQSLNKIMSQILPPFKPVQKRRFQIYPIIDYSDYNFPFKAYPTLNTYTQKVADRILNLINENPTRDIFQSEKNLFAKQYVRSMRYYAENLFGYTHHQYDYKNNLALYLTISMKFFIRLLTFYPCLINTRVLSETKQGGGGSRLSIFDVACTAITIANTKMSLQITLIMKNMPEDD